MTVTTDLTPEMYVVLRMCAKTTKLSSSTGRTALRGVYLAQAYTTLVMLVELVTKAPYTLLCISSVLAGIRLC